MIVYPRHSRAARILHRCDKDAVAGIIRMGDMKFGALLVGAVMTVVGSVASAANAAQFTIDALNHSIASPLDTGLILNPGTTYNFSVVNPATIWSAGAKTP